MTSYSNAVKIFFFRVPQNASVFFLVTLSANQNAYSYRISGGGGISVFYNKISPIKQLIIVYGFRRSFCYKNAVLVPKVTLIALLIFDQKW